MQVLVGYVRCAGGVHNKAKSEGTNLAEIQPLSRGTKSYLDGLERLAGQGSTKTPALADIGTQGCVAVRLDAVGEVVEGGGIRNLAGHETAGKIGDLVGQAPPYAAGLLVGGMRRRRDGMALDDQRIQVDHLLVVMQEFDDDLAGDARRQRRDGRERRALRHGIVSGFRFGLE